MKCGNEKCDYELYLDELDFVICPKCGELIRGNLQPEHFKKLFLTGQSERFREETSHYEHIERWLRLSPLFLWLISQLFVFGVGGSVLADTPENGIGIFTAQRILETQMVLGLTAICFMINKAYDYLRVVFGGDRWHRHLWPHLMVKAVAYGLLLLVLCTNQIPEFYAFLEQVEKVTYLTEPVLAGALVNARFWFTGLILWNLVANYIADALDAYNERRVYLMNKIIMVKPIE